MYYRDYNGIGIDEILSVINMIEHGVFNTARSEQSVPPEKIISSYEVDGIQYDVIDAK